MDVIIPMQKECIEAMEKAEKEFAEKFPEYGDAVKFRKGFIEGWTALHKHMKGW